MTEEVEQIFATLRPVCIEITQQPFNATSLDRLRTEILKTPSRNPETWRCLFDYIIFPLRVLLRRSGAPILQGVNDTAIDQKETIENALIKVFDIFRILTDRCGGQFNRVDIVISLLSESFLVINNPPGSDSISGNHDLIVAITEFTSILLESGVNEENLADDQRGIVKKLLENRPVLAQIVFALVRCLKKHSVSKSGIDDDEKRRLQSAIVRCLSAVIALDDSLCAAFLPGVASALTDFILNLCTSSREQFIVDCMETWTKLVVGANRTAVDSTSFSDEWRRNAALQLSTHLERLSSTLISHPATSVRRSLCNTALQILNDRRTDKGDSIVGDCRKRSLEIVAACIADDQMQMETTAVAKIQQEYADLVEKMLVSTCWRLPRSSRSPLSSQQRVDWQCLLGYLHLLGPDGLSNFLLIDDHKEALLLGLVKSLEFGTVTEEVKPTSAIPEEEMAVMGIDSSTFRRRIHLKAPSDQVAEQMLLSVCKLLAELNDMDAIYEYFYRLCSRSRSDTTPSSAMYILNAILSSRPHSINPDIHLSFVDLYLTNLRNADSLSSLDACLNLEGLGNCARCLGSQFQPCLIEAFYVVLATLRFADYKDHVWVTLFDFAKALGFETVLQMVLANSDYLSSSLTLRLRRFTLYPDSALILAAILDILSWESMIAFRGTISETLKAIDHFAACPEHRQSIAYLLKVLERFCALVVKRGPRTPDFQPNSENAESEDEQKKPLPWHILLVVDILHRIRSWIFADGIPTRLASLRVLDTGLQALADHEDSLLPIVHQTWPSTLARLTDVLENEQDERLIIVSSAAFEVMVRMALVSRNFVCRRIEDEAWPKIKRILQRYLPVSKRANALVYRQSPSFRFQLAILESFGGLCRNIQPSSTFLQEIIRISDVYDSQDVLPALRNAAAKLRDEVKALLKDDVDACES